METYPITRKDGSLYAFEVESTSVSLLSMRKILKSVPGVTDVRRQFFCSDRLAFNFENEPWIVNYEYEVEPWVAFKIFGDSGCYWIGPKNPTNHQFDVNPVHNAFLAYDFR